MDIYILRDGKETGPFSEETTRKLLHQGSIADSDYAWHSGLPKWLPVGSVLNPVPPALETPPPPPPAAAETALPTFATASLHAHAHEFATAKQKALLSFLAMPFSAELSKDQAALLINEAMEDPKKSGRFAQWNTEKLKLHPDLFETEINERKEGRAGDYLEICQTAGAEYFSKITKAHCQVVVGYLDIKFPDWDDDPKEAPRKFFFPAVAEKFPQLVAKAWKDKLRYDTGPKPAEEPARKPPTPARPRRKKGAPQLTKVNIARGLVFAVIFVAMYLFVRKLSEPGEQRPSTPPPATSINPAANPPRDPLAPPPAPVNGEAPPPDDPDKKLVAQVDPLAPVPAPVAPEDPAKPPADPKMADPAAPKPAEPLPGFPPDPLAPAPAPAPAPVPVDPLAPATPAAPTTPPATPADPAPVAKSVLKLTKAVDVQLAYGKMKLPVGTPVKFVSREGNAVRVNYLNTILTLPVSSTDFGVPESAPAPAPAPGAAPSPAPPPAAQPPAMAPKSDL